MEDVVKAVEAEVTNVEAKVEQTVAAVEAKAEEVKAAVEAEAKTVEKKFATEPRIAITDAENLALTKMELQFVKVQMEIKRLGDEAKAIQETYPKQIATLVKKYAIDETTHVFNAIEGAFTKK